MRVANRLVVPQSTQPSRVISTLELISKTTYRTPCGLWLLNGLRPFPAVRCAGGGHALSAHRRSRFSSPSLTSAAARHAGTRAHGENCQRMRHGSGGAVGKWVALSRAPGAPGAPPRRTWQHTADDVTRQATGVESNHQAHARHLGWVVRLDRFADKCANDARPGAARHPQCPPERTGLAAGPRLK